MWRGHRSCSLDKYSKFNSGATRMMHRNFSGLDDCYNNNFWFHKFLAKVKIKVMICWGVNWDRLVDIALTMCLTVWGSRPDGEIIRTCPDRPWGPPSLLYNGHRFFPGVKQLGRGVDHPPPSSAKVKERVELYLYSPSGPSLPVRGWTLPLLLPFKWIATTGSRRQHGAQTYWARRGSQRPWRKWREFF
jgi:hypothetical protein